MHYASDTYNIMNVGYETYATNWSLKDGRLIMYLITMICAKLNISIEIYVIGTLLGIHLCFLSAYGLYIFQYCPS